MVGEEFGADGYEVSYHSNPRPSHADMGGRQYAKGEARTVKGVYYPSFEKEAEPLLNEYGCLHFKFSILLGISRPTYSKEQLEQMKAEDKQTFEFEGKEYTRYEASQLQRKIETAVRHEKDLANMAKASGDDDLRREAQYKINLLTSKYAQLSKASGLPTKMERMQVGGFRRVKTKNELTKAVNGGIIKERGISSRNMAVGMRKPATHILSNEEIKLLRKDIQAIGTDESIFKFNFGQRTSYDPLLDEIRIKGDILPDKNSKHPRDLMSSRAVLAHEYYGHRAYRKTKLANGSWNDEFRASYMAAQNAPNLSDEDRRYLILDALERAKEKGITLKYNEFIRRILHG